MPTKIDIPKTSELLETIRTPEQLVEKFPKQRWMVQPKYDGSKCVLLPLEDGYVALTGGGNKIECIPATIDGLNKTLGQLPMSKRPVLEAEIEPEPWTQENKVKLNGNLYKQGELPFSIKLSVFDAIAKNEFETQGKDGTPFEARLKNLKAIETLLTDIGVNVSPHMELTSEEVAAKMRDGIEAGKKQHRVIVNFNNSDLEVEGMVIRNPNSTYAGGKRTSDAIKLKPFVSLDLLVVLTGKKENGMAALGCVDTKEPDQPYFLFTGLPKDIQTNPNQLLGQIVEIEVLTTDNPKLGAGNPTYKNPRPDKSFNGTVNSEVISKIEEKLIKAGMVIAGQFDPEQNRESPDL